MGLPLLGTLALLLGVDAGLDVLELTRLEVADHWGLKCLRRWHDEFSWRLEQCVGLAHGPLPNGLAALLEEVDRGAPALYSQVSQCVTYWK